MTLANFSSFKWCDTSGSWHAGQPEAQHQYTMVQGCNSYGNWDDVTRYMRDGTVEGTGGSDLIDFNYTGDPEGDQIDHKDATLPGAAPQDDLVYAYGGNDTVKAGAGNDVVYGGDGNDTVYGEAGDDKIYTEQGNDVAFGGAGNDKIVGNNGADTLSGDDGNDLIYGGGVPNANTNLINNGSFENTTGMAATGYGYVSTGVIPGWTTANGAQQIDVHNDGRFGIPATDGRNWLDLEASPGNIIIGQNVGGVTPGQSYTLGFDAADLVGGGNGIRVFWGGQLVGVVDPSDGSMTHYTFELIGGAGNGNNRLEFEGTGNGSDNFGASIDSVTLTTTSGGDDGSADVLFGGLGNDTIYGYAGNDTIGGGTGNDVIFGGDGNDVVRADEGDDTVYGGEGNDTIFGSDGNDSVSGGNGDDLINTRNTEGLARPDIGYPGLYTGDTDPFNDRDIVDGGAGNDTILTGDDRDTITGGSGDDRIDAGFDDDSVDGGTGNDTIEGNEGRDLIYGGAGNDVISGGFLPGGADGLNLPDAIDLVDFNNSDTQFGGAGDDTIYGMDDADTLFGGTGNDRLDGGIDDDVLDGDTGNDTLIGGQGNDDMSGGDDRDVFLGGNGGDMVDGGGGGDDFDTLNLTGSGVDFITYTSPDREDGVVTFLDGTTMAFTEIENVVPCFTPGTAIATPRGERLVEELRVGDRIITRDNGIQEIRWVGRKDVSGRDLIATPHLKPIMIRAGALGNGLPERDMLLSPNHRILVSNDRTQLYFEESEVLAAAKHLIGSDGIYALDVMQTSYIHFMFDRHEVVLSNGAWTESFQPGDQSLKGIGNAQRNEIYDLFPELATSAGIAGYQAARKSLKKHEARLLVK